MSFVNGQRELYVEFKENSMHLLERERTLEIPLQREPGGRLPAGVMDEAARRVRAFADAGGLAHCSIPVRGVSLRRLSVPAAAADETRRLLAMQLEAQLPVPPSDLAWGCQPLSRSRGTPHGSPGLQEFVVVAVRKELLEDYRRILSTAGLQSEFTVGALARQGLCPKNSSDFSVLEAGRTRSELAVFDDRGPLSVRILPWGVQRNGESPGAALENGIGQKLYLLSDGGGQENLASVLAPGLKPGISLELVEARHPGTPANEGLKKLLESGQTPIFLGAHQAALPKSPAGGRWKWAVLAGVLAVAALVLRYAEAVVYQARLSRKLANIAAYRNSLPRIEREFNFLNYIKTNQPPDLDVLTVLAQCAPPGTRIDSLSLVRHGDLSLRGSVGDAQAPGAFRSKLIDSGFFSRVVVDEQAPTPDGQKFTFRISAQVRPDGFRKTLSLPEPKTAATNSNPALNPAGPHP